MLERIAWNKGGRMFGTSGRRKESSYETISLKKVSHVTPKQNQNKTNKN